MHSLIPVNNNICLLAERRKNNHYIELQTNNNKN